MVWLSARPTWIAGTLFAVVVAGAACASQASTFVKSASARRPYMGWSSWSTMRLDPTAAKIKAQARILAARLKKYGYVYINIDSGWWKHANRRWEKGGFDRYGRPQPDLRKFPGGIKPLAAYIHALGLKIGLYIRPGMPRSVWQANDPILGTRYRAREIATPSIPGNTRPDGSCGIEFNKPGAVQYLQSWANEFAAWGVDFLKVDWVGPGGGPVKADDRSWLAHFAQAVKRTGRPIWLELSSHLNIHYAALWRKYANGWRITGDIEAYGTPDLTNWLHVSYRFRAAAKWARFAGPGGWNDLDSLEIGNGKRDGLTPAQRRTTMTLWCLSCAPLYLGSDLTHLTRRDFKIITNRAAIAIDQAGRPATPVSQAAPQQVWRVPNANGTYTVALFNLAKRRALVTARWASLGFHGRARVRDLWLHRSLGVFRNKFNAVLGPQACRLLTATPVR